MKSALPRTFLLFLAAAIAGIGLAAQQATPPVATAPRLSTASTEAAERAADRIRALQKEADLLARQERSLLVDLRRLEVERDIKLEQARQADAQVAAVQAKIADSQERIRATQAALDAARPGLEARMVETYKLGRPGYARLLLNVESLTEMARASRMLATMADIDRRQVEAYNAAIARLQASTAALGRQSGELRTAQAAAREAGLQAERASAARAALVKEIDARRDLNARMVAELETARDRLTRTFAAIPATSAEDPTMLPLRPFRGALEWPAPGKLSTRFGEQRNRRFGTTTLQNGIEVATSEGAPVRAIHEGRVAFAGVFTGFGQLVIVDHGGLAYSLYGYLSTIAVIKGQRVNRAQPIGTTGRAPGGNSSLYFELRIDGKPVDPLQWLKVKQQS